MEHLNHNTVFDCETDDGIELSVARLPAGGVQIAVTHDDLPSWYCVNLTTVQWNQLVNAVETRRSDGTTE